ncbi:hypothetical protein AHAS_Ahas03G0229500 [Arachis hypogaea]
MYPITKTHNLLKCEKGFQAWFHVSFPKEIPPSKSREDEEKKNFTIINPSSTTELPLSMRGKLATHSLKSTQKWSGKKTPNKHDSLAGVWLALNRCVTCPSKWLGVPRPIFQVARSSLVNLGMPRLRTQVARHSGIIVLVCHAFELKWQPFDFSTFVPRYTAQVARPCICAFFKLGVPRLGLQVARQSDFLELACHAFDTKWHAVVEVLLEVVSWHATPLTSSGMPIVVDGSGVPRPTWRATPLLFPPFYSLKFCTSVPRLVPGVPLPHACLDLPSGI